MGRGGIQDTEVNQGDEQTGKLENQMFTSYFSDIPLSFSCFSPGVFQEGWRERAGKGTVYGFHH